jgi:hypothetical protein
MDEDRRRADKFKDKRARKAAKRPFGNNQSGQSGRRGATEFAAPASEEAGEA